MAYWFHPLCRLAASRLRSESERACDDAVLRLGFTPSSYAGHLVEIARMFNPQPAIAMAATSELEFRVKSILDPLTNHSRAARRTWIMAALLTVCAVFPISILNVRAQQPASGGAELSGTVFDPSGARVPGANVIAANPNMKNREVAQTDAAGDFAFHSIPAGRYMLEVRVPGFDVYQQNNITVEGGAPAVVNPKLSIGGLTEKIAVIAAGAPRTQPQANGPPVRIRIGGNVQAAKLTTKVDPIYPADLQVQGVEGTVLLNAVISKEGVPLSVGVRNTAVNQEFADAALDAIRQWRYQPTLLNGEPVEVITTVTVDFRLRE